MKYLILINQEKLYKIKAVDYSDIWVVKDGEEDKYVENINKFQDDLIEGNS